jgi:hypothetical protein
MELYMHTPWASVLGICLVIKRERILNLKKKIIYYMHFVYIKNIEVKGSENKVN